MRIVVAMSGGVDSSVVAGLLVEQGHEVIGLAMKTHSTPAKHNRACCTPDDMRDARHVADLLDIPFYVLNYEQVFQDEIVGPFARAYAAGRTPNPCVVCNDKVKFRPLLARAKELGADALATGHYARIVYGEKGESGEDAEKGEVGESGAAGRGEPRLLRGVDASKDQSYFLYRLTASQLAYLRFPLGSMTKTQVRAEAERLGLPVASKRESQEICFVGDDGYAATVERILGHGGKAGQVVHTDGRVLGQHDGVHKFTLGQRRGLRIAAPQPLYVTDVDGVSGTVRVGEREALLTTTVQLAELSWVNGVAPDPHTVVQVQQRYRETPKAARLLEVKQTTTGAVATVAFVDPQSRGAPGQAAVLYDGNRVLGGGTIDAIGAAQLPADVSERTVASSATTQATVEVAP